MDKNDERLKEILKGRKLEDLPTIQIIFTTVYCKDDFGKDTVWSLISDENDNLLGKVETSISFVLEEVNAKIEDFLKNDS